MSQPYIPVLRKCLIDAGYKPELIGLDVCPWDGAEVIPLVAHSRPPLDIRTAAIAVTNGAGGLEAAAASVRRTGASLVFAITDATWECGRVSPESVTSLQKGNLDRLDRYFQKHHTAFNPDAIYRAKAWGRFDESVRQLDFVDLGLLPVVESELGARVSQLLEEVVQGLASELGWQSIDDTSAGRLKEEWLIKAPFWLFAAKTLRDKRVPSFKKISLSDFEDVFARLARHYQADRPDPVLVPKCRHAALLAAAEKIDRFASVELMSTEALSFVYESTLINSATRKRLGTHSTPTWLIDYIMGQLRPWVQEMPPEERVVFEPACGHAGFLVSALRLLDELRPDDFPESRLKYLRRRLYGVDIDAFSQEVARLALTLADVPNPNGWSLALEDMFESDVLGQTASKSNIVLANPPFEMFGKRHRPGWLFNQAAETLQRIARNIPVGGVFAFVLPQSVLRSSNTEALRRYLLSEFEIPSVSIFDDNVFEYGEPESAVIIARRRRRTDVCAGNIEFRRVRKWDLSSFRKTLHPTSTETVSRAELAIQEHAPLFVPESRHIWIEVAKAAPRRFEEFAQVGHGFLHKGINNPSLPEGLQRESTTTFPGAVQGFAGWRKAQMLHLLPELTWLNLDPSVIAASRGGTTSGVGQVVLNYVRASRGIWRLKAIIDEKGHPVTSDYFHIRPKSPAVTLKALWAILNSPLANAYAHSHLTKKHNSGAILRTMPVPNLATLDTSNLERAVDAYLSRALTWTRAGETEHQKSHGPLFEMLMTDSPSKVDETTELMHLHWQVDAEVLRLYGLPPRIEQHLLTMFDGHQRKGVPYTQLRYLPDQVEGIQTLDELLTVLTRWDDKAALKTALIEKKVSGTASQKEIADLQELTRLSGARRELLDPLPIEPLKRLRDSLLRELAERDE